MLGELVVGHPLWEDKRGAYPDKDLQEQISSFMDLLRENLDTSRYFLVRSGSIGGIPDKNFAKSGPIGGILDKATLAVYECSRIAELGRAKPARGGPLERAQLHKFSEPIGTAACWHQSRLYDVYALACLRPESSKLTNEHLREIMGALLRPTIIAKIHELCIFTENSLAVLGEPSDEE